MSCREKFIDEIRNHLLNDTYKGIDDGKDFESMNDSEFDKLCDTKMHMFDKITEKIKSLSAYLPHSMIAEICNADFDSNIDELKEFPSYISHHLNSEKDRSLIRQLLKMTGKEIRDYQTKLKNQKLFPFVGRKICYSHNFYNILFDLLVFQESLSSEPYSDLCKKVKSFEELFDLLGESTSNKGFKNSI